MGRRARGHVLIQTDFIVLVINRGSYFQVTATWHALRTVTWLPILRNSVYAHGIAGSGPDSARISYVALPRCLNRPAAQSRASQNRPTLPVVRHAWKQIVQSIA